MNQDSFESKINDRSRHESELEVLISRLVDGEANDADWDEFRSAAAQNHEPWRRLAEEQRMLQLLRQGFEERAARAVQTNLPGAPIRTAGFVGFARRHVGWAAAIVILLGWLVTGLNPARTNVTDPGPGRLAAESSPDAILASYMESPRVIGQGPLQFVRQVETEDGVEFEYLRLIIERRPAGQTYDLAYDENGNPIFFPEKEPSRKFVGNGV